MRVMCDTNILVRAVISPYGAAAELVRIVAKDHSLVTSSYVLAELLEVLRRPKIRRLHKLSDAKIRRVVSRFYKLASLVSLPSPLPVVVPLDPKDNPIVMTAVAGQAEVLCTLDHHLHEPQVVLLCANHGVRVLRDAELLVELRVES
jgi:putative PIN family toxin of toxin-antitoxin system